MRAACQTPPANPPAAGLAPAACRSPSSAEVCRGRELIKNMMNQENAELRAAPPPRPAPAPGPMQQGWTRGHPCRRARLPLLERAGTPGCGDARGLGVGSAGDFPSRLGLRLARGGRPTLRPRPQPFTRPELRASRRPAGRSGRALVTDSAISQVKGACNTAPRRARRLIRPPARGTAGPAARPPWAPSRCRPEGFPRVTATSAFTAPAPFGVGARGSPNPRSVSHPERLKRGPRATGPSLCKHFLGPTLSRSCARPAP